MNLADFVDVALPYTISYFHIRLRYNMHKSKIMIAQGFNALLKHSQFRDNTKNTVLLIKLFLMCKALFSLIKVCLKLAAVPCFWFVS